MGRACDCCDDDIVACDTAINFDMPCLCGSQDYGFDDSGDYVTVFVFVHNLDDETKNNCYYERQADGTDKKICDFEENEFTIRINSKFIGNNVGDPDAVGMGNWSDSYKKTGDVIGVTAPFRDSEDCGGFDPVCKCITPQFSYGTENPLFPCVGYIIQGNTSRSQCAAIGGQFLFEDDCEVPTYRPCCESGYQKRLAAGDCNSILEPGIFYPYIINNACSRRNIWCSPCPTANMGFEAVPESFKVTYTYSVRYFFNEELQKVEYIPISEEEVIDIFPRIRKLIEGSRERNFEIDYDHPFTDCDSGVIMYNSGDGGTASLRTRGRYSFSCGEFSFIIRAEGQAVAGGAARPAITYNRQDYGNFNYTTGSVDERIGSDIYYHFFDVEAINVKDIAGIFDGQIPCPDDRLVSPTFDPSVQSPNIPDAARTKISVTIAATSEEAVNKFRNFVNSFENTCASQVCFYSKQDKFIPKKEILTAIDNGDVIIYDKDLLRKYHDISCGTLEYYYVHDGRYRWWGDIGFELYPSSVSGYVNNNNTMFALYSEKNFYGSFDSMMFKIIDDRIRRTSSHTLYGPNAASPRGGGPYNTVNPNKVFDYDFTSSTYQDYREYSTQETRHRAFDSIIIGHQKDDPCCSLTKNIEEGKYSIEIDLGTPDYGGKEPAFYEYYYHFAPTEEITYTLTASNGHTCEFTSTQLDRHELPECLVRSYSSYSNYIYYKVDYGNNLNVFNSIDQFSSVGFFYSADYYNADYLVYHEQLMPDCKYDLRITHRLFDENEYNCNNFIYFAGGGGSSGAKIFNTYIKPWEGETLSQNGNVANTTIIRGTQYGYNQKVYQIYEQSIEPGHLNKCVWSTGYTFSRLEPGDTRCGYLNVYAECGFEHSEIASEEIPISIAINNPGATCSQKLSSQRLSTYKLYYGAGEAEPEEGYCNQQEPPGNANFYWPGGYSSSYWRGCKTGNVLKKATTTEWLEKSMGKACGGMINIVGDKIVQHTVSPDPRERHNREVEVLRIKNSEYKGGKFTLNFSDAEEHTDELGSFFIIKGPSLQQLFDTSKINLSFIDGPSLDDYLAESFNVSNYGKTSVYGEPNFIGVETVPLSSGMEFRYRIIGGQVAYSLTYPISLSAHNVTELGKSIDVFGSARCVDDCCTEYEYDPPVVSRELPANVASIPDGGTMTCRFGGEGVNGSIQNSEGLNAGWEYFRHTALLQKVADNIPDSYDLRGFEIGVYSRTTSCASFISSLETLFTDTISYSYYSTTLRWFNTIGGSWSTYIPRQTEAEPNIINPKWTKYAAGNQLVAIQEIVYAYGYSRLCGDATRTIMGNEVCNAAGGDSDDLRTYYNYRDFAPYTTLSVIRK